MNIKILTRCGCVLGSLLTLSVSPVMAQVCMPDTVKPAAMPVTFAPIATVPAVTEAPKDVVVKDLERDEKGFPKWSNFPSAPQNLPTAADISQRVGNIKVKEGVLEDAVANLTWDTGNPEAYSAATRARLNAQLSQPVTKNNCLEINQFAIANRAKAVPPPSPDR